MHQHQRPILTTEHEGKVVEYIEVMPSDIELANTICESLLQTTISDLPAQTAKLLQLIQAYVQESCQQEQVSKNAFRFGRKELRDYTGWGSTQLNLHLKRLESMEHILIHCGGRGKRFEYELLTIKQDDEGSLLGLTLPELKTA